MTYILLWNIRGGSCKTIPRLMKDLTNKYQVDTITLLETRVSGEKANGIIS